MMKELTLWGYFTSEPGANKALRYIAVPGKYQGCIDYKKGDKAHDELEKKVWDKLEKESSRAAK